MWQLVNAFVLVKALFMELIIIKHIFFKKNHNILIFLAVAHKAVSDDVSGPIYFSVVIVYIKKFSYQMHLPCL